MTIFSVDVETSPHVQGDSRGAVVTPERIAELRTWAPHRDPSTIQRKHEMLDEIERLRGLVVEAHRFNDDSNGTRVVWISGGSVLDPVDMPAISVACRCGWRELIGCRDPNGSPRTDEAKAAHAAHVAAILDGGAK